MKVDWLIVGAGFTGAVLAERIAAGLNQTVLVVDKRSHFGGNAYDEYNEHGILCHRYGPHIFHTSSQKVWNYLSSFTEWRPYFHKVLAQVEGNVVPVPFNLNSLHSVFPRRHAERLEACLIEEYGFGARVPILKMRESSTSELAKLATFIYDNVFRGYTLKQWQLEPDALDPAVTGRVPICVSRDDRYFQDRYQAMPSRGYTEMFRRMLAHPNIHILLQTDFRQLSGCVHFNRLIFTGPIDSYFGYLHGNLPYRSVRFSFVTEEKQTYQAVGTVNFPNEYDFTRITEQKYLTGQQSPKTTIVYEYPEAYREGENEPSYPIPQPENRELYERYVKEVSKLNGSVLFAGRLADYRYYNMDQACARALKVFESDIASR